jgi:hypothetical protein
MSEYTLVSSLHNQGTYYYPDNIKAIIDLPRFYWSQCRFDNNNRGDWESGTLANGGINFLYGLYDLIVENFGENCKDFVVAEIGCYAGVSTSLFAATCKFVYAIDPWGSVTPDGIESERRFDEVLKTRSNIKKMKMYSVEASPLFEPESLDAVYIDGDHSYKAVLEDIDAWYPKIKRGGILCGHDFTCVDVSKALQERFPEKFPPKHYCDVSWAFKKD